MKSDTGAFALTPEWVLDSGISDRACRLYGVLGRYADADGVSWPSRRTLAERLSCSSDSIDRAKQELIDAGALLSEPQERADGSQTANLYTLIRSAPTRPPLGRPAEPPLRNLAAPKNESHLEREPSLATAAPPRKRDDIFDALVGLTGIDPSELTKPGRGALNGAVRELRLLNASGPDVIARAHAYSRKYPNAVLTAPALVKHWAELGNGHRPSNGKSLSLEESKATFAQLMESP